MPERFRQSPRPSLPAASVPAPGEVIGGKYVVDGVLGAGGMGVVLAARHLTLGQPVAIKILPLSEEDAPSDAAARLLREARAAAALSDEHVVRVYDVGEDAAGKPFIVMERLQGSDLGAVLHHQRPLPIPTAVALVQQAARAVAAAHRAGIVHRDLKPSNLFVTRRSDGSLLLKVLDFGIAKSLRPATIAQVTLTGARMPLGSPAYMSPEQVRSAREVDTRTDLWSLGMILYELLTGEVAFEASTLPGLCAAIVADAPVPPSVRRPDIPAELDAIVLRCLAKEPSHRFASAEELIAALSPHSGTPELAPLPPGSLAPETLPTLASVPPAVEGAPESRVLVSSQRRFDVDSHVRTLASEAPAAAEAAGRSASAEAQRSMTLRSYLSRRWVLGAAALALAAGVLATVEATRPTTPAPAPAPAPAPRLVTLVIDSVPPGARVTDGRTDYGTTPVVVTLVASPQDAARHVFTLELEGYRPYVVEHAPSQPGRVDVRAELVREVPEIQQAAAPSAPALSSVAPKTVVRRPAAPPAPVPAASETPVEIRLSR